MTKTRVFPQPRDLARLKKADPKLAKAMKRLGTYPGYPEPWRTRQTHFANLAKSIAYQQLAGAAARTIFGRVCALTPGPNMPTPAETLAFSDAQLRGAGLSRAKVAAIRDLAQRVEEKTLRLSSLGQLSDEDIIEQLTQVRGIGPWTAQMFLMFRLGRLDVMPGADLAIQEGLRLLDNLKHRPTPNEVLERAEAWKPLRSVASWVLWGLVDDGDDF